MSEAHSHSPSGPGSGGTGIVVLASAFLGILIGGAGTFAAVYGIGYRLPEPVVQPEAGAVGANPGGGPPMGSRGGMGGPPGGGMGMGGMGGGGMGMGGMGGGPRGKRNLTQLVGKLELLTRGKLDVALTPEQTVKMSAILAEMNQAEKMTADEAQTHLDTLEGLLTAEQKEIVESIGLPFGGRGGGPGGGRPGGGGMGPPGGGMGGPGGMMGGGGPDDENPFKQEANQKRLQDFLSRIKPAAAEAETPANNP
jgi:hypothetical protein